MLAIALLSLWLIVPVSTVVPGMTQQQVEAVLNEKPTTFLLSGSVSHANIKVSYYNSRLLVSYGPDGKVNRAIRMKK